MAESQSLQNIQGVGSIATMGTQVFSGIASTISSITGEKQQLAAQNAIANLSLSQQNELNQQIQAASDNNQKLAILANAMVAAKTAGTNKGVSNGLKYSLLAVGVAFVGISLFIILHKRKVITA